MADKKYYWLKFQHDFFSSKRMKKLRSLAGGDTFTIIYLKMQLKSLETDGVLEYTGLEKTFAEEIALDIDEAPDNVGVTINYLISCGLMEQIDENHIALPYAIKNMGSELTSTERVRAFRERKKTLELGETECNVSCNVSCNETVTESKSIEIEKEKDIDIDSCVARTPKKESASERAYRVNTENLEKYLPLHSFNEAEIAIIKDWLLYKAQKDKKPYTEIGIKGWLTEVENTINRVGSSAVINQIQKAINSGWQGTNLDNIQTAKEDPWAKAEAYMRERYGNDI